MTGSVHVEERDAVATVRFDNREKRNALNPPLIREITETFEALNDRDDIRAVVLTGTGEKAFSAGFDITYFSDDAPEDEEAGGSFSDMVDAVKDYDYPTIAMINGGTYGGAMHLIAGCDLRVAVDDAEFAITPAKLGLVYRGDAIYEVMNVVGPANVKEFLFTADFIDAQRAYDMGLLNDVVPREELEGTTYDLAERIAGNAPLSLKGMKAMVDALVDKGRFTEIEQEWTRRLREESEASDDHAEGVAAFQEGRDPEFEGR